MHKLILLAASLAPSKTGNDQRNFCHAAVGIRGDGVMVSSRNGAVITSDSYGKRWSFPSAHAEARVSKKMNYGGVVYVARISRVDGHLAMSKPCFSCMMAMRARGVSKVFYSISDDEYGFIDLRSVR